MTQHLTISKLSDVDAQAVVRLEIARLNAGAHDCQRRIMEHLERVRQDENWDWREDDRLQQLEQEHRSWVRDRDALVRHVMRIEMLKPPGPLIVSNEAALPRS